MRKNFVGADGEIQEIEQYHIKFVIGQIVYMVTDPEQLPRIVCAIKMLPDGCVKYQLAYDFEKAWCYDFEISDTKNIAI